MKKHLKLCLAVLTLVIVTAVAAGCGSSQTAAPAPNTTETVQNMASVMPMEDPNVFVKDMQQTLMMITEQTKLNKLDDAKKATAELIALQEKLAAHLTDAKQKEGLRQAVLALQAEVQQPSPSQSAIDKQMEIVKKLLNEVSSLLKNHKHQ